MAEHGTDDLPDHVRLNREVWDTVLSPWYGERARQKWAAEPEWGVWGISISSCRTVR